MIFAWLLAASVVITQWVSIGCKTLVSMSATPLSCTYYTFFYKGQFIRAKMMSTENFGKNKGQSVLNFLDVKGQAVGGKISDEYLKTRVQVLVYI